MNEGEISMAPTWELRITRLRQEKRKGMSFARTVSSYEVFHNGILVNDPTLTGFFVERQGPGDNKKSGDTHDRRIEAGTYALSTHSGAKDKVKNIVKYKTIGYATTLGIGDLPRPSIRFLDTGARTGILIHPGNGYIWSVGCFNPGHDLVDAKSNLTFAESREMVIALIDDMKSFLSFPTSNNKDIVGATAVIVGEPA
jgi:hypothetical protein